LCEKLFGNNLVQNIHDNTTTMSAAVKPQQLIAMQFQNPESLGKAKILFRFENTNHEQQFIKLH